MAELFALLRGSNCASLSSTPPSGQGPTADPTSWIPPTQVPESIDAPAPPTTHTTMTHPFTIPFPPPPAPTTVPLPPAAFLTSDQALSVPPPVSMPAPAAVYTVPPPMIFPASSVPVPAHLQAAEPPPYPSLQPHTNLPYQASPPINTTFLEPGTPTHAAYLFPGMRLPPKVKIPEFRTYEGTTDPRHHLRHYQETPPTLSTNPRLRELLSQHNGSHRRKANPLPDHGPAQGPSINMISICALGEGESEQGGPSPFMIEYIPAEATVGFVGIGTSPTPFVIDIPARETYLDDKVPWTYEGGAGNLEQQFSVIGLTRSGWLYENLAATDKGKAPAVEIEAIPGVPPTPPKKVTEEKAEAFMKIIKASEYKVVEQMAKSPAHISLFTLLLSSKPHREALLRVLTATQVPKGTPPDRIKETMHSAGAVPSSLHQRLKFIVEEKLITIKGEEDYSIYKETAVPYISVEDDENLPFHSFETISIIRDYEEIGPSRTDRMIGKVLLRYNYIPGTGLGARGQVINRPIEVQEYKDRRGLGFHPSCHEIIEARRGNHLHRFSAHYGKFNRGIPIPPLSHFFPGPPHIIWSTPDGPSSDSDDTPDALPAVYAVTEEIPSGVDIRPAQENEELSNWTSVPH
ncbi:hypothetical protein CRG98_039920 [Punica granatum]|uniref:G-patch domain-containing protein n=1 Tax=Punica granatum TaxID=22663 RepID=A0A2I0I6T0_PUNGR|nr:hypothetical protein CRG98_039920 [Punica granatum]